MNTVKVGGDWSYIDELDGIPLKEGELVRVEWPDGSITEEKIRLERGWGYYTDHGIRHDCSDIRGFVDTEVRGLKIPVSLRQHKLRCERLK